MKNQVIITKEELTNATNRYNAEVLELKRVNSEFEQGSVSMGAVEDQEELVKIAYTEYVECMSYYREGRI
jgi:hypothetical protein